MIHCDEVFDILTRGPFPTGAPSDGIVESHLNQCDACRQLAEALRPAIELMQEAIGPEESSNLPRYGGAAADAWSETSALKTKSVVATHRVRTIIRPSTPVGLPWRSAARFAAAACVGLVVAALLRQVVMQGAMARRGEQAVAAVAHWRLASDARQWVDDISLGDLCRQPVSGLTLAAARPGQAAENALNLACCLGCHAAKGNPLLPTERVGAFVQACQACH